jgi:SNF2-related domain
VGYGKTAITLGLIDSSTAVPDPPRDYRAGFIHTKATLVVVPGHLMDQWPSEVKKFLGSCKRVAVVKNMLSFNSVTVDDILNADIVIVNFTFLSNQDYFARLAQLCGVDDVSLPSGERGGRYFEATYTECLQSLQQRCVPTIVKDSKGAYSKIIKSNAQGKSCADDELEVVQDGKKAAYKGSTKNGSKANGGENGTKSKSGDRDPWGFSSKSFKSSYKKMKSPPFEMFYWNRLVVDE